MFTDRHLNWCEQAYALIHGRQLWISTATTVVVIDQPLKTSPGCKSATPARAAVFRLT
jgi:hypothetical protein